MDKIFELDERQEALKELLEFYCGFRGTNITLMELEEKLEKLYG